MPLPEQLPVGDVLRHVVTWQDVLKEYEDVAPAYWTAMLATALDRYKDLLSKRATFGVNADDHLPGTPSLGAEMLPGRSVAQKERPAPRR